MSTVKEVEAFYDGVEMGFRTYAYWKDGVQYVGTTGMTLAKAIADMKSAKRVDLVRATEDREQEIDAIMDIIDACDGYGLVLTEEPGMIRDRVSEFVQESPAPLPFPMEWTPQDTANWQAEERAADAHLDDSDREEV